MRAWLKGIGFVAALAAAAVMAQTNGHRAEIVATMSGAVATPTPTPSPEPTAPTAGYAAWFDAAAEVYTDVGGTVPATADGDAVNNWKSKDGSFGALSCTVPGGYGAPHLKLGVNGINGKPVVRALPASFEILTSPTGGVTIFEGGILNVGQGTVMAVALANDIATAGANGSWVWGDNAGYLGTRYIDSGGLVASSYLFDTGTRLADKGVVTDGAPYVLTWHHEGGVLYSGLSDTRTASMASVVAGDLDAAAGHLSLLGAIGGRYLNGDLAEIIFYPTALTQPERKVTERYLAAKYGIALPY